MQCTVFLDQAAYSTRMPRVKGIRTKAHMRFLRQEAFEDEENREFTLTGSRILSAGFEIGRQYFK